MGDPITIDEMLRHARWVEELARRLVRDPEAARDVAQSAWAAALCAPPRRDARAWLGRVVRNLARERHRREAQRGAVERAGARSEALPSTSELLARTEAERRLVEAVTRLEEPHRSTLLLRYFEGLAPEEIARREGVALSTVANRITRAHARLRESLARSDERSTWLAALAPILVRDANSNRPIPHATETRSMSTLIKSLAAAIVVVASAFLVIRARSDHSEGAPENAVVAQSPPNATPSAAPAVPAATSLATPEQAPARTAPSAPPTVVAAVPESAPPPTGIRIHGVVHRPDGLVAPLRKVRMLHMVADGTKSAGVHEVVTDANGHFEDRVVAPGAWNLSTWPAEPELVELGTDGQRSLGGMQFLAERTLVLADGDDVEVELGAPPEHLIRVQGRVLDGETPIAFDVLQWFPVCANFHDEARNVRATDKTSYSVVVGRPGPYLVAGIFSGGRPEWRVDVPDAPEATIDLRVPNGVVRGIVRTPDGRPVAKASVSLAASGGGPAPYWLTNIGRVQTTGADGRFRFERLPEMRWSVVAYGGGVDEGDVRAAVLRGDVQSVAEDRAADVELVAEEGVRVPLKILSVAAEETYAYVFVFDANGEPLNAISSRYVSKKDATLSVPLVPGSYTLYAQYGFLCSARREIVVERDPNPPTVELQLGPLAQIDVDAGPHDTAYIDVRDEKGRRFGSLYEATVQNRAVERDLRSGHTLFRVPAGNYDVVAIGRDGPLARAKVVAKAGEISAVALK